MNENFKLAWRNIWRNKRRTLITTASIFFAMAIALNMRAYQLGTYDNWLSGIVEAYTGYIQVQHRDFWLDQTLDNTFPLTDDLMSKIKDNKNIKQAVPRIQSGSLASFDEQTKVALIFGIDVEKEQEVSKIKDKLVKYKITENALNEINKSIKSDDNRKNFAVFKDKVFSNKKKLYFELKSAMGNDFVENYYDLILEKSPFENKFIEADDDGIVIANRLAKYLQVEIGDTIVLTGIGYHAETAEDLFVIRGVLNIPNPQLDGRIIYMSISRAQEYFSLQNMVTSVAINLKEHDDASMLATVAELEEIIKDETLVVKDWKKMNEMTVQQIEMDNQQGLIMLGILYLIVGFGIFGTVMMMTSERKREFGVMIAIGMQKVKLSVIVTLEMILMSLVGIVLGIVASLPIIYYYYSNPIYITGDMAATIESYGIEAVMPFAWETGYFINQSLVIIFIVLIASFYPVYSITRIKVSNALRA